MLIVVNVVVANVSFKFSARQFVRRSRAHGNQYVRSVWRPDAVLSLRALMFYALQDIDATETIVFVTPEGHPAL